MQHCLLIGALALASLAFGIRGAPADTGSVQPEKSASALRDLQGWLVTPRAGRQPLSNAEAIFAREKALQAQPQVKEPA